MSANEAPNKVKVVIMGLDNGGKSSIVYCLRGIKNLMSFVSLTPTRGLNIEKLERLGSEYAIWDFGGQEQFRTDYIANMDKNLIGTIKLIFVIDIQDSDRFDVALAFLKNIINNLVKQNYIGDLSIFLHKWDPDIALLNRTLNNERINDLINGIKDLIPSDFSYKLQKTSIYTLFEKTDID